MAAVMQNGGGQALKFASEALRNDKEVVLAAVKQNGYALHFASEKLKNNKDFVLDCIKQHPHFSYTIGRLTSTISKQLSNDKDVIMAAVNNYGLALEYASERLKDDKKLF